MDQHKATIKSISKLITLSSQHFFSAFLEDSQDQKNKEKERSALLQELQVAAAQKSLVVLQLKEVPTAHKFETVIGWIVSKNISDNIVVRLQTDEQQLPMIPVASVMKVSTLANRHQRQIH